MLFLLLFKPEVAFAREWDRYILSSLGVMPFMFVGLKQLFRFAAAGTGERAESTSSLTGDLAACIAPALVITLVMSLAWIGINSSSQRSEARFEKLLGFEKKSAADGYEQLSFYYANQGKMLKAGEAAERAFELNPTPLNSLNLSMLYLTMEDTLGAIDKLTGSLQNDPSASMIRRQLITLLDQTGRYRELIQVSKAGAEREPEEPQYYYFLGKGYLYMGRLREGIEALRTCKDMNPPQPIIDNIEALMGRIRKKQ
jgi:tetratricopeptide (TPR) repeat protein